MSTFQGVHLRTASEIDDFLWFGRTTMHVVLGTEHTNGGFALIDQYGAMNDATPLHVHHDEDEAFYLLAGSIEALAGDERCTVEEGSAIFLPRGLKHAFRVASHEARILTVTTPAGFDGFIRSAGIPYQGDRPLQWEFDPGRMMAPAQAAGIEILGPPPF